MAVIQYVGARYVPKIFENPNGSSDWLAGVSYEPLVIVTYAGNSYTSKKPVPATVGTPNANPEYWASTGIYNAQIEQIRQDISTLSESVEDINDEIDTINNTLLEDQSEIAAVKQKTNAIAGRGVFSGKIICIGDSYLEGYNPDGNVTGWGNVLANTSGCLGSIIKYQGGCGFARESSGKTFYTLLVEAVESIPAAERDDYSAIIIGGGYNDGGQTTAAIREGIHDCATYAKTNMPNARLIIAFAAWCREPDSMTVVTRTSIMARYMEALDGIKVQYIPDAYMALAFAEGSRLASDGKHPTQTGQNALAAHIQVCANGGNVDYKTETPTNITTAMNWYIQNKQLCINVFGSNFMTGTVQGNSYGGTSLIATRNDLNLPFKPNNGSVPYNGVTFAGIMNYKDSNNNSKYIPCSATVRINENGGFNIYIAAINDTGTGWLAGSNTFVSLFMPVGIYRFNIDEL